MFDCLGGNTPSPKETLLEIKGGNVFTAWGASNNLIRPWVGKLQGASRLFNWPLGKHSCFSVKSVTPIKLHVDMTKRNKSNTDGLEHNHQVTDGTP